MQKGYSKICPTCEKPFTCYARMRIYCSAVCRPSHNTYIKRKPLPKTISTGSIGAISELIVCADLLEKGYSVFRSVSPASPFDLCIYRNKKFKRIEVTTGGIHPNSTIYHSPHDKTKYDILAVVLLEEHRVVYEPNIN